MPYHLYTSNHLEAFVPRLAELVTARPFFNPAVVVVQNTLMERRLKVGLARHGGAFGNVLFENQESVRAGLLEMFPSGRRTRTVPGMLELQLLLDGILAENAGPDFPAGTYFRQENAGREDGIEDFKRFALAGKLAELFTSYGKTREDMVRAWTEERRVFDRDPAAHHEAWQSRLWRRVFGDGTFESYNAPFDEIRAKREVPDCAPDMILCLVGSVFFLRTNLDLYRTVSRFREVHHFLLSPCRTYYGDLVPGHFYSGAPAELHHLLLENWGKLGRQMQNYLLDFEEVRETALYRENPRRTVLGSVQNRLLDPGSPGGTPEAVPDRSLSVFSCAGNARQAEVLHDLVLECLENDPGLDPSDIAVAAPDIDDFRLLLEAAFLKPVRLPGSEAPAPVPLTFMDLSAEHESTIFQGMLALAEAVSSRFAPAQTRRLFQNPCFKRRHDLAPEDGALLERMIRELNVRGLSERRGTPERDTWDEAFRRILLGRALSDNRLFHDRLPAGTFARSDLFSLERIFGVLEALFEDFRDAPDRERPVRAWCALLKKASRRHFQPRPSENRDWNHFSALARELDKLDAAAAVSETPIGFPAFAALLRGKIAGLSTVKSLNVHGGVQCGSIRSMRAVPFRVIFLLGMDENAFPARESRLSFDLRHAKSLPLDATLRDVDRYAFLEALIGARDRFAVLYNGRDPVDNRRLEPSIPVRELLEFLESEFPRPGVNENRWIVEHPLYAFDPAYFTGDSRTFTFKQEEYRAVRALLEPASPPARKEASIPKTSELPGELAIGHIEHFMKNPARAFLRDVVGARAGSESRPEIDSAGLDSDRLQRWRFWNDLGPGMISPGRNETASPADRFIREQVASGRLHPGAVAEIRREELEEEVRRVRGALARHTLGAETPALLLGNAEPLSAPGVSFHPEDGIRLPALELLSASGRSVRISGVIPGRFENGFFGVGGGAVHLRHFVRPWLYYLLLRVHPAASADTARMRALVFPIGKTDKIEERVFALDEDAARECLGVLADAVFHNRNGAFPLYPDVCEALLSHPGERGRHRALEAFERIKNRCPETRTCFRNEPDFSDSRLLRAAAHIYGPLCESEQRRIDATP